MDDACQGRQYYLFVDLERNETEIAASSSELSVRETLM